MKKALTLLLTLCMLLSFVPTAFAVSTAPDFSDGWTALTSADSGKTFNGGNYYLNDDIALEAGITFIGTCVLDLNGHVIKINSALYGGNAGIASSATAITAAGETGNPANFTLQDSNPTAKHYFSKQTSGLWKWEPTIAEETKGYELVEGGVIAGGYGIYGGGINATNYASANLNGGNIVGCQAENGGGIYNQKGTVTMNGGNIIGCVASEKGGGIHNNNGTVTMNGGNIKECVAKEFGDCVYNEEGNFKMTGGLIKNRNITGNLEASAYYSHGYSKLYADGGVIDGKVIIRYYDEIMCSDDAKGTTVFNRLLFYAGKVSAGIFYGDCVNSGLGGQIIGSTYTVNFYANDTDTEPFATAFIVGDGTKLVPPTMPEREDYTLVWYTENGSEYDFDSAVASDFSLYAEYKHTNHADNDGDGKCDKCGVAVETEDPENPEELREYIMDIAYEAIIAIILIVIAIIKYYA